MCLFQITIKEEDRLSTVIAEIDEDVKIVPRGAFVKSPTGQVVANRSFEGKTGEYLSPYCPINVLDNNYKGEILLPKHQTV